MPVNEFWEVPPEYKNKDGNTMAMLLASNGIDIPRNMRHDPYIENNQGLLVMDIFIKNK